MPVFVSHATKDEGVYNALCVALDGQRMPRWDVKSMVPDGSLAEQLRSAINECDVCILIATRRSLDSKWCLAEVGAFWGAGKPVILYVADPDLTETDYPPQFQGNLRTSDLERVIERVRCLVSDDLIKDLGPPFDYRWLKAEHEARDRKLFRQAQQNSTKAQYLVIRGRQLLSQNGEIAALRSNTELSHLIVQVLLMDISSFKEGQFNQLKKQMDLNWGDFTREQAEADKRVEFLAELSKGIRLEYKLLPPNLVPELKMRLYDNFGYFTFYRRPGLKSGSQNRSVFCVTSSPLLETLRDVFNRLWLEGRSK
jgi:TIR domain